MDMNKLTLKSQEALAAAQAIAKESNNGQVDTAHLMMALLGQAEGVVLPLLQKLGVAPQHLRSRLGTIIERAPRVYGQSDLYLSNAARSVLENAATEAERLGDIYVSTEHLARSATRSITVSASRIPISLLQPCCQTAT